MANLQDLMEGKIDFIGQKRADDITRIAMVASVVVAFVLGFALQSLRIAVLAFAASTVLLLVAVVPPWPVYNSHPVQWLPAQEEPSKGK
ncbi:hypothetical protein ID866_7621 [Astraeus odoratus]|nr:hypothetical protein ID866_7621 [Astraeus odoratus]